MTRMRIVVRVMMLLLCAGCGREELISHRFGIKPIALADGRTIYLKREVGLNYDKTSLSLDSTRCKGPNYDNDYVFRGLDAGAFPLYYLPSARKLTIYVDVSAPTATHWPITVEQQVLDVGAYARMEIDYRAKGISRVELTLNELTPC